MKIYGTVLFIFTLAVSCQSTKKISGTYYSNFAVIGFFGTKINFKSDSTFDYRFSGDLFRDQATGTYKIEGRLVKLSFDPDTTDYESLAMMVKDSLGNIVRTLHTPLIRPIDLPRPSQLKISGTRLLTYDDQGKIVRRELGHSRIRTFLFWGGHFMISRRYCLKQKR
jgi:hypothetical protein